MKSLYAILAVFQVTRRRIVNSRAFAWMLLAVLAVGGFLPFTLRGNGSTESLLKLAVIYPPVLLFVILLVGSLWTAAALCAQDIESGAFTATIVKPAPLPAVWLGKWLGVLALNAILLAVAGTALRTAVAIRDHASPSPAIRVLDGHAAFLPDDATLREEATARQIVMRMSGAPAADSASLLNQVKTEAFRIPPGQRYTWTVPVGSEESRNTAPDTDWSLQFRFHCAALERSPIHGTWTIRTEEGTERQVPVTSLLDGIHQLPLASAAYHGTVSVSFSNHMDSAATVFFSPLEPVTLLHREITFSANLLRALLLLFCFLAAAAALALSLGTLFSFPVAVFTSIALVLAVMLAHTFAAVPPPDHSHGAQELAETAFSRAGEWMLGRIHHGTATTLRLMPLGQLADARVIGTAQLARAAVSLLVAIPAFLCLLSSLHLRRREFPQ